MTVRSNPRILVLFGVIVALFAVSILGFIFLTAIYGIIFLAISVFLSYQFVRFALSHIRSRLSTDDDGIRFHMPSNEDERFEWEEVSQCGYCTPEKGRPFAFVYSESRDRLITIPKEYEYFDELLDELRERATFTDFALPGTMTIQEKLREILGIPEPGRRGPEETDPSEE